MPVSLPTGKGHHIPWARGNELGAGHSCKSFASDWLISRKGCNTRKSLVLLQCILVYSNEAACCRSWLCRAFANVAGQMVIWRSFPNGAAEWMGRTGGLNTSATCNYSACWEWKSPLVIVCYWESAGSGKVRWPQGTPPRVVPSAPAAWRPPVTLDCRRGPFAALRRGHMRSRRYVQSIRYVEGLGVDASPDRGHHQKDAVSTFSQGT